VEHQLQPVAATRSSHRGPSAEILLQERRFFHNSQGARAALGGSYKS